MRREGAVTGLKCPIAGTPCVGARAGQESHAVPSLPEKTVGVVTKLVEAAWGCPVGRGSRAREQS